MTKKVKIRVVCGIVAFFLVAVLIAGNIVLNEFAYIINQFFAGDTTDYGDAAEELAEGDKFVQKAGEESMVLLKNEEDFLPLEEDKVNLFGWAATDQGFLLVGGGSGGTVIAEGNKVTLTQAFKKEKFEYNEALLEEYSAISSTDADKNGNKPDSMVALTNPGASFYSDTTMEQAKNYSNTAVVVLSRFSGENASSTELISVGGMNNGTYLELTENEKAMFDALQSYSFDVVVLLNTTNNMELGFLEDYSCIKAALYVGIPGQSGALAIPRILRGDVNPSGRLADTFAYDYQTNNPSYINGRYVNDSMAYAEGIYVGYKWYETANEEGFFDDFVGDYGNGYDGVVQFPFGYGLSYTDFEWEVTDISWNSGRDKMSPDVEYAIEVTVHNTGGTTGRDVVQLYYTPPYEEGGIEMASINLLAFAKTDPIPAGGEDKVTLKFTAYDLASYDDYGKNGGNFIGWEVVDGDYTIKLMKNSHEAGKMYGDKASSYVLASDGIEFPNDPVSKEPVKNRFTGKDAYAGTPIDGSTVIPGGVDYLSRADGFANYPKVAAGTPDKTVDQISKYEYDGYDDSDISDIHYGVDAGMYLVLSENSDGTLTRATAEQLDGTEDAVLAINEELMSVLSDYDAPEWDIFLDQLSQTEIADLIGKGGFQTIALYSVGKPKCTDRDGPAGFNMGVSNPSTETKWTGFPTESLLGCCWDTQLAYQMGVVQGKVAQATGLQGWYAPGLNLHRSVYNTRNYEYFSEDTTLTADLGAQIVKGAKDNNLYCYVKHFAVSEAGANPNDKNTWLTEQALRETYLRPFEAAVKEGGANAMMSAFNRVGAVWAGSNHALLVDVLRTEWGFRGSVVTDWAQPYYMDYTRGLKAGNSLWLDGSSNKSATIDFNDSGTAYAARQAAKDILYTYVVTTTYVAVTATPESALFSGLWIGLNVLLGAGIAVCVLFIVKPVWKKSEKSD